MSEPTSADAPRKISSVPGIGLWVLVSGALLYGVVKTVDTALPLFTGG